MKRLGLALAFLALFSAADAQVGLPFPGPGTAHSTGGGGGLSIDGTANGNTGSGLTTTATLTTTQTNDRIVVMVETNDNPGVSSVADTAGLTWTLRATNLGGPSGQDFEEWSAVSSGVLTADVITVTTVHASFTTIGVAAISGSTGFDPVTANTVNGAGTVTIPTTSHANAIIYAGYRVGTASPTAGAGWSTIFAGNFFLFEYQIVSSIQTGTVATISAGSGTQNGAIGDAIF